MWYLLHFTPEPADSHATIMAKRKFKRQLILRLNKMNPTSPMLGNFILTLGKFVVWLLLSDTSYWFSNTILSTLTNTSNNDRLTYHPSSKIPWETTLNNQWVSSLGIQRRTSLSSRTCSWRCSGPTSGRKWSKLMVSITFSHMKKIKKVDKDAGVIYLVWS